MSTGDLGALASSLRTRWLGHAHEHHASLPSTSDRAAAWAADGAPHGALVTADAQTAGRGRRGRTWASPPGVGLHASVVVRPPEGTQVPALGLAVGVGLREGLPVPAALKWPNDLVVDGRKLGGILCEARWLGAAAEIVVGFGINVRRRRWPDDLAGQAIALEEIDERVRDRGELLAALLSSLESALDAYLVGGFAAIRARYEPHCVVLGQRVRLGDPDDPNAESGVAVRLDEDGALLLRPDTGGGLRRIEADDVWLLPPNTGTGTGTGTEERGPLTGSRS